MIRKLTEHDIDEVMNIWLTANQKAHSFIENTYWIDNYSTVKAMIAQAEVYVYECDKSKRIVGCIGLDDHFIAGIFVQAHVRSNGIGKQLLDYAKAIKSSLKLQVYAKNERAVAFYLREQFRIQDEQIEAVHHEKELLMTWNQT